LRSELVIGHRGAPSIKVENSLESIVEALRLGVDGVEVDVRATKDGSLVAFHDKSLSRVLGVDKLVSEVELNELRGLGQTRGFTVPTIEGVVEVVAGKALLVLDVKEWRAVKGLIELLRGARGGEVVVSSFDHRIPLMVKREVSFVEAGIILSARPLSLSRLLHEEVGHLFLKRDYVDLELLKEARDLGVSVHVWVVNDEEEAERFWSMGARGVVTDVPQRLVSRRRGHGPRA
jgi:glycerophosphoryl diester phosphodiesterase